jgi:hypothetical protein
MIAFFSLSTQAMEDDFESKKNAEEWMEKIMGESGDNNLPIISDFEGTPTQNIPACNKKKVDSSKKKFKRTSYKEQYFNLTPEQVKRIQKKLKTDIKKAQREMNKDAMLLMQKTKGSDHAHIHINPKSSKCPICRGYFIKGSKSRHHSCNKPNSVISNN